MSRTRHHGKFRIVGDKRPQPDARRLAKALVAYVEAQREAEALADAERRAAPPKSTEKARKPEPTS